ncbi:hypothetical protein NDU88_003989 [Pleurodeles waltl]|uniref:Uncharacterized protein n=1 Tax=Pleurodeles waltl TaxID=8319 RepID=A0AAV7M8P9_PLEWA|nr:hypothetical protein NDU88_003989 [Pleurodeles waltl]
MAECRDAACPTRFSRLPTAVTPEGVAEQNRVAVHRDATRLPPLRWLLWPPRGHYGGHYTAMQSQAERIGTPTTRRFLSAAAVACSDPQPR